MDLEKQVTSVELSNKLHKLGVAKPSIFYREWTGAKEDEIEPWNDKFIPDYCPDNVNCYTVAELGEMLPDGIFTDKGAFDFKWNACAARYSKFNTIADGEAVDFLFKAETEADARAKMLIYLLENNLLD